MEVLCSLGGVSVEALRTMVRHLSSQTLITDLPQSRLLELQRSLQFYRSVNSAALPELEKILKSVDNALWHAPKRPITEMKDTRMTPIVPTIMTATLPQLTEELFQSSESLQSLVEPLLHSLLHKTTLAHTVSDYILRMLVGPHGKKISLQLQYSSGASMPVFFVLYEHFKRYGEPVSLVKILQHFQGMTDKLRPPFIAFTNKLLHSVVPSAVRSELRPISALGPTELMEHIYQIVCTSPILEEQSELLLRRWIAQKQDFQKHTLVEGLVGLLHQLMSTDTLPSKHTTAHSVCGMLFDWILLTDSGANMGNETLLNLLFCSPPTNTNAYQQHRAISSFILSVAMHSASWKNLSSTLTWVFRNSEKLCQVDYREFVILTLLQTANFEPLLTFVEAYLRHPRTWAGHEFSMQISYENRVPSSLYMFSISDLQALANFIVFYSTNSHGGGLPRLPTNLLLSSCIHSCDSAKALSVYLNQQAIRLEECRPYYNALLTELYASFPDLITITYELSQEQQLSTTKSAVWITLSSE